MSTSQKFRYVNGSGAELRITLEPWADQYLIRSGQQIEILVSSGDAVGTVELEQHLTGLVIYGYAGCTISLVSDGAELKPCT